MGDDSRGMSTPRRADEPRAEGWKALEVILRRGTKATLQGISSLMAREHRLGLVAVMALVGGTLMILAEFLTLFEVRRGPIVVTEQSGGEHHSYALLILGAASLVAALVARSGHWAPAAGVAVLAALALAIALVADLPDATSSGLTAGARPAEADPAAGFWVQTVGASLALVGGLAMTYLIRTRAPRG
jgi:hypothetical protein